MGRLRHLSNSRTGVRGTVSKGNIIYDAIDLEANLELYEVGTTKKYPLGTRLVTADGRVFRYAKAEGDLIANRGVLNHQRYSGITGGIVSAFASGVTEVNILLDSTTSGATYFGVANNMAGGSIVLATGTPTICRQIVKHPAGINAETITITLDGPTTRAITAAEMAEVMRNPYQALVQATHGEWCAIMGVTQNAWSAGDYGWIQTWGVTWITPSLGTIGVNEYDRECIFLGDGSIVQTTDYDPTTYAYQHAGFLINWSSTSNWSIPPFLMLQISP